MGKNKSSVARSQHKFYPASNHPWKRAFSVRRMAIPDHDKRPVCLAQLRLLQERLQRGLPVDSRSLKNLLRVSES